MQIQCTQCGTVNQPNSQFCSGCGGKFAVAPNYKQPKKKNSLTPLIIVLSVLGLCGFCGLIGKLGDKNTSQNNTQTTLVGNGQSNQNVAPTPTQPPPTFAELKTKGEQLLKFEKDEYVSSDLKQFDDVMQPLREIPKESKDYKQAQILLKKLIDKVAPIGAEIVVLGEKPSESELYVAFNRYLRPRLNDYDSSEYVNYTQARKVTVKGQPFWVSVLTLRAKNAFGGYILKDVTMYIRKKEVVLADGL
jgi:hypothetical protein